MHIVLLCAAERGVRVLDRLAELAAGHRLTVFSFREDSHEPPFLDRIATCTRDVGGEFIPARDVGGPGTHDFWSTARPDLMIAVGWRYLVPREIYTRPALGTVVFHDSLLPTYRGFSPTVWAIVNGEDHTGASLFHMADGVDEGDLIDQRAVPIGPDETIAAVMERVTGAYLELLSVNLPRLLAGTAPRTPQDSARASYTCKRLPGDNRIAWSGPTDRVYNLIRGTTTPYPGAFTSLAGRRLTIWTAARVPEPVRYTGRVPGRVVRVSPCGAAEVLTGDGVLRLTRVQQEGDEPRPAAEVLNRVSLTLGP